MSLEKTLYFYYSTGTLFGVEDNTDVCFTTAYIETKKKADTVLHESKVGINHPMLNVSDRRLPRVRRINGHNQLNHPTKKKVQNLNNSILFSMCLENNCI